MGAQRHDGPTGADPTVDGPGDRPQQDRQRALAGGVGDDEAGASARRGPARRTARRRMRPRPRRRAPPPARRCSPSFRLPEHVDPLVLDPVQCGGDLGREGAVHRQLGGGVLDPAVAGGPPSRGRPRSRVGPSRRPRAWRAATTGSSRWGSFWDPSAPTWRAGVAQGSGCRKRRSASSAKARALGRRRPPRGCRRPARPTNGGTTGCRRRLGDRRAPGEQPGVGERGVRAVEQPQLAPLVRGDVARPPRPRRRPSGGSPSVASSTQERWCSATTAASSRNPRRRSTSSRSAAVVAGTIRSTTELGNARAPDPAGQPGRSRRRRPPAPAPGAARRCPRRCPATRRTGAGPAPVEPTGQALGHDRGRDGVGPRSPSRSP